jgi:hypothetical protein
MTTSKPRLNLDRVVALQPERSEGNWAVLAIIAGSSEPHIFDERFASQQDAGALIDQTLEGRRIA